MPWNPINPYGRSKLMVEQILRDYESAYGLKSMCLRYFNAAGADPDGEIGESHEPETHLVPLVLRAASGRAGNVTVFGADHDTPDGTCIRDYVHVNDLCEAHLLALRALRDGAPGAAYNLGNGDGFSVQRSDRSGGNRHRHRRFRSCTGRAGRETRPDWSAIRREPGPSWDGVRATRN